VQAVKARFAIALFLLVQLAQSREKGVTWSEVDPFCGQVTSTDSKDFPVVLATVALYRAKAKHIPCCEAAEPVGEVKLDANGNFDLRKQLPGEYWFVVSWDKISVPVPLWVTGKHSFACSDGYKNVIAVNPRMKSSEKSVQISQN